MKQTYGKTIKRKMHGERFMLTTPFNVVMTAKLRGYIDTDRLRTVIEKLRKRHALLAVRVMFDANNEAWYTTEDVPELSLEIVERQSDNQWEDIIRVQYMKFFEITKGPLVRFVLIHNKDRSELIICAHHIICDGLSLTYLIRDILTHLVKPDKSYDILPEPPVITSNTVPTPPVLNSLQKIVMRLINKKWGGKNIHFTIDSMKNLHRIFWEKNIHSRVLAWELTDHDTQALVERCRQEKVTVNTALWTAFMMAQHDIQGSDKRFYSNAGIAVNIREKLLNPAEETFGFFASTVKTKLTYKKKTFWELARIFHKIIKKAVNTTNPFQQIITEYMHPTLIDSLYYNKYGIIHNKLSKKFLKKMRWDKINYGYSLTNVGNVPIPHTYGDIQIESVYGPLIYSDVNEKTVGVTTVKNTMTFIMSYNKDNISTETIKKIKNTFSHYITKAIG